MLDEKRLKEIEKRVRNYIDQNIFLTKQKIEHVAFFVKAKTSLQRAVQFNLEIKKILIN